MIQLNIFLSRKSDLTHEEFLEYWTEHHTPLLASLPAGALKVHRYVQLQATEGAIDGVQTSDYDGVAELWVDSIDDAAEWFTSDTYTGAIAADEEHFLDRSKTRFLYATESVIFG